MGFLSSFASETFGFLNLSMDLWSFFPLRDREERVVGLPFPNPFSCRAPVVFVTAFHQTHGRRTLVFLLVYTENNLPTYSFSLL